MTTAVHPEVVGSPSIADSSYWWYRARAGLLESALAALVPPDGRRLDVGSADGPSVSWYRDDAEVVSLDLDPRGLRAGGVCGSAVDLPFADETFAVVAAFDVVEHCEPEARAMAELVRVLTPGGRLLLAVPAYQWAWTRHDDLNGHHRRYTRPRAVAAVVAAGLAVDRATYLFASTFPFFAADRTVRRLRERKAVAPPLAGGAVPPLPPVHPWMERVLLGLSRAEQRVLARRDLPFGSSVVVAATKPPVPRSD